MRFDWAWVVIAAVVTIVVVVFASTAEAARCYSNRACLYGNRDFTSLHSVWTENHNGDNWSNIPATRSAVNRLPGGTALVLDDSGARLRVCPGQDARAPSGVVFTKARTTQRGVC